MESSVSSCERPECSITTALTGMSRKICVDSASRDMGDFFAMVLALTSVTISQPVIGADGESKRATIRPDSSNL